MSLNLLYELEILVKIFFGLEDREYGRRYPSRWPRGTLYPQIWAPISTTSGGSSVDRVR
jgi:hypothetical protein